MSPGRRTVSEIRVRYSETDQMGIVHHRHHLVWCEVGRTDYIRTLGTTYAALERQGIVLAVADVQVRYIAPARYDDLIRVTTWLERVQSRALTFAYELARVEAGGDRTIARATTRLIALDAGGAPCQLPAALLERLREGSKPAHD